MSDAIDQKDIDDEFMKVEKIFNSRKKKIKAKIYRNEKGELNRSLDWITRTDKKIITRKIEVWFKPENKTFDLGGCVSYDDCDNAVRYWKSISFSNNKRFPIDTFLQKNLDNYISAMQNIKLSEIPLAGKIENPFPRLKLKHSMKIVEITRKILNFFSKERI